MNSHLLMKVSLRAAAGLRASSIRFGALSPRVWSCWVAADRLVVTDWMKTTSGVRLHPAADTIRIQLQRVDISSLIHPASRAGSCGELRECCGARRGAAGWHRCLRAEALIVVEPPSDICSQNKLESDSPPSSDCGSDPGDAASTAGSSRWVTPLRGFISNQPGFSECVWTWRRRARRPDAGLRRCVRPGGMSSRRCWNILHNNIL